MIFLYHFIFLILYIYFLMIVEKVVETREVSQDPIKSPPGLFVFVLFFFSNSQSIDFLFFGTDQICI